MPVNVARALIRRAWIGQAPPTWIVFRDQEWSVLAPNVVVERVSTTVASVLACTVQQAQWFVERMAAPIVLVFATRPMPSATYVSDLCNALPSALLFFLTGNETQAPHTDGVIELPLPKDEGFRFIHAYKQLMESVAPRTETSGATASEPSDGGDSAPPPKRSTTPRPAKGARKRRSAKK